MARAATLLREILRRLRDPVQAACTAWTVARALRAGGLSGVGKVLDEGVLKPQRIDARAYAEWVRLYDTATPERLAAFVHEAESLSQTPLVSVLMPVYDAPAKVLEEAIESVLAQAYPHWELCVADDASPSPHVAPILRRYAARDARIRIVTHAANGGISAATNSAFAIARGEWIALLDHDDLLAPHALLEVAKAIARNPDAMLIYSDEDKIDEAGHRFEPFFKPDPSPTLLRGMNYFNHLTVHRAAQIRRVGGWRPAFNGSQDYDLNLRIAEDAPDGSIVHIPRILYHWRALAGSVAQDPGRKSYAWERGRLALREHWQRLGSPREVADVPGTPYYRAAPLAGNALPHVTIVIPTRDGEAILRRCIRSIHEKTAYPSFDIVVVDNGSRDPGAKAYLAELSGTGAAAVVAHDAPFNFSAICNRGVREARGPLVLLLNNDIEVISPHWLAEMASHAVDPAIGCVGAKLRYADGSIQHAGIVLGIGGIAGHAHKHAEADEPGYFGRLLLAHEVSAVTAACLLVRKDVYDAVGGLDETRFAVAFNDVDFCLRVREAGFRNVVAPFAELYHLESATRGAEDDPAKRERFARESAAMRERWGAALEADPFYSPNLTLAREDLSLAHPPRP